LIQTNQTSNNSHGENLYKFCRPPRGGVSGDERGTVTMALIACTECGQQVSDKAATCPHCGNPLTASRPQAAAAPSPTTTPTPGKFKTCAKCGKGVRLIDPKCWNCGSTKFNADPSGGDTSGKATPEQIVIHNTNRGCGSGCASMVGIVFLLGVIGMLMKCGLLH
jgi:RNA polymerase subunit RPABC4/transcription elongation factor Spt4